MRWSWNRGSVFYTELVRAYKFSAAAVKDGFCFRFSESCFLFLMQGLAKNVVHDEIDPKRQHDLLYMSPSFDGFPSTSKIFRLPPSQFSINLI